MLTTKDLFASAGVMQAVFDRTEHPWQVLGMIEEFLAERLKPGVHGPGDIHPAAVLAGDVYIAEGAVVEPGAFIQGPCWIGPGSQVRHGAYIRGSVVVGEKCVVGHATEAKNAVFLDEAKAGHFAYVGDCILGCNVNLGAGTKLANFKLDGETVKIRSDGVEYDTYRRKVGAFLGDGVQTGCNSVTSPGCIVGCETWIYANTTVPAGVYPARHILSAEGRRLVIRGRR